MPAPRQSPHRVGDLRARRVVHPDETEELELLRLGRLGGHVRRAVRAPRDRQHAQRFARQPVCDREHALTRVLVERRAPDDRGRRPLDVGGQPLGRLVQGRHALARRVERRLAAARIAMRFRHRVEARPCRANVSSAPSVGSPMICQRPPCASRVASLQSAPPGASSSKASVSRSPGARGDLPDGRVAGAADVQVGLQRPRAPHRHLVGGQRPGLVGADHRRRAERLHGRQAPDERVALGHALRRQRQRQRHASAAGLRARWRRSRRPRTRSRR